LAACARGDQGVLGSDDVHDRIDQCQVGEGLREVAQVAARARVDLLGIEAQRPCVAEQALAKRARAVKLADLAMARRRRAA